MTFELIDAENPADPRQCRHEGFRENPEHGNRLQCAYCGYVLGKDGTWLSSPDSELVPGEFATREDVPNMQPAKGAAPGWKRPVVID